MTLLLKFLLAPALVVASSLAGRRWGPAVAGVLVALPVVVGPILLITCLEHGRRFAADAAASSLLGLVGLAWFTVVIAWCSRFLGWVATLLTGWSFCLALDLALAQVRLPPLVGFLCVLGTTVLATAAMPRAPAATETGSAPLVPGTDDWNTAPAIAPPAWDLPARALATDALVLVLTGAAAGLGPQVTGALTPFPIASSVVAGFSLAQAGHAATVELLRGFLRGLAGLAVFCLAIAVLLPDLGPAPGFTVATLAALLTQVAVSTLAARAAVPRIVSRSGQRGART